MTLHIEKQTIEQDVCTGFDCDRCGRQFDRENFIEWQERLDIQTTAGYGSIWGDGNQLELQLCQECAHDILGPYMRVNGRKLSEDRS